MSYPPAHREILLRTPPVRGLKKLANTVTVSLALVQAFGVAATLSAALAVTLLRSRSTGAAGLSPKVFLSFLLHAGNSDVLYNLFSTLAYFTYMFAPLCVIAAVLRQDPFRIVPKRVRRPRLVLPAVAASFVLFALGNFYADYFSSLLGLLHLQVNLPEFDFPGYNLPALLVYAAQVAVVAPLCEEFLFRGLILQNLRRYGDFFAVLVSSALFGVLHGNFSQTPFAFLAGVGLAFAVLETGSVWVGVALHCFNNAFSILLDGLAFYYGGRAQNIAYGVYLLVTVLLAGLALLSLRGRGYVKELSRRYGASQLPSPVLVGAFVRTPGCIVFLAVYGAAMFLSLRPL